MKLPDPKTIRLKAPDERLPYRLRERFMSGPELALYRVLVELVEDRYVICPKVGLNDIFFIVRPNENVHYFNKIFRKHVDFLLCHPKTLKPAFGIELVKSLAKDDTRERDQFMEDLFLGAGLPLVQIPWSERYNIVDLVDRFKQALLKLKDTGSLRANDRADSIPMCPVCGRMMVLRVHRVGPDEGQEYYGCVDNPHCPGVVEIK
ncbi:MAG TPA: DUF2726 domain-containing protein [Anaerolineales bacterium]|nr:DUF2726 domain-containing protein [Anaerolineales bacterium]